MKIGTYVFLGAIVAAGVVIAAEATDPTVKARQELMDTHVAELKILGGMAKGEMAFDAAAAEAAKAALVASSADIGAKFETQAEDPKSKSKPEIWTSWDDFLAKANALNVAATALDVSSVETIGAGLGPIGAACQDCHKSYQIPG